MRRRGGASASSATHGQYVFEKITTGFAFTKLVTSVEEAIVRTEVRRVTEALEGVNKTRAELSSIKVRACVVGGVRSDGLTQRGGR